MQTSNVASENCSNSRALRRRNTATPTIPESRMLMDAGSGTA
jgi:hypothetical protein